jgi:MFS family permease
LSWFFLPYFVFSQGFRFFSLSKEALRADKTGLAIAIVSYTLSCLFLTVSTSPPTVALAGALSGLAGAATTPLFLAWISSVFSSRAAFMTQVVGAVAAIGYASWLSTAHANVFSVVPAVVLVLFVLGLLGTAFPESSSPWRSKQPAAGLSPRETSRGPASSE